VKDDLSHETGYDIDRIFTELDEVTKELQTRRCWPGSFFSLSFKKLLALGGIWR
jgi:hypothetical protein